MHPIFFEGSVEIKKPEDMTDEQCISAWAKFGFDPNDGTPPDEAQFKMDPGF